jgi:hypothetical protein
MDVPQKLGSDAPAVNPLIGSRLGSKVRNLPRKLRKLGQHRFLKFRMHHPRNRLPYTLKLPQLEMIDHGIMPNISNPWQTAPSCLAKERFPCVSIFTHPTFVPVSGWKDRELWEEDGLVGAVFRGDETTVQSNVSYVGVIDEEAIFTFFVRF